MEDGELIRLCMMTEMKGKKKWFPSRKIVLLRIRVRMFFQKMLPGNLYLRLEDLNRWERERRVN
jgi:hypothetical protein